MTETLREQGGPWQLAMKWRADAQTDTDVRSFWKGKIKQSAAVFVMAIY
ncbi:hypothetical protein NM213_14240 [Pseudomonas lactis]|uniref:Uncharacterized protein n=1 Tax=Pseudomonas lactis TaxID=1615674 RepID=A0A7Y1QFS9_9PSED|nr:MULTISPECIES: hypothetical protein [Pseudomonas]MBD8561988.1 hypothetical protein [Pseudomonas fluorescens]MBI6977727.1 hypothetical protein [Pseudomonas lactis]MCF4974242.1 hypothetical protein [Pseudomonas lactis]MCF5001714.1 hypothetical protein [Pseudomonas lactis]MCF5005844.1 hypothetical protein [Pseudomonas lactis]